MECGKSEMTWKLFFSVNDTVGKPYFPIQHFRSTINHIEEMKVRLCKPCQKSDTHTSTEGSFLWIIGSYKLFLFQLSCGRRDVSSHFGNSTKVSLP